MVKKKVVLNVAMDDEAKKRKALTIAVSMPGVRMVSVEGDKKLVVSGEDVDAVELTEALRRRLGYADILSVITGEEKKPAPAAEEKKPPPAAPPPVVMYPPDQLVPYNHPQQEADSGCRIM